MAIRAELMKLFSDTITQQMAAITAQYDAHMKATNETHTEQIQMMLGEIPDPGGAKPGFETNWSKNKLDRLQGFSRRWTSLTGNGWNGVSLSNRQFALRATVHSIC